MLLFIESWRFLVESELLVTAEQATLGNWVSLFAGGSGLGLYI